jgi:hypothetical protein
VLTINGQSVAHHRRFEAQALLNRANGSSNMLTVQARGGEVVDVELRSEPMPILVTKILAGSFGLLR